MAQKRKITFAIGQDFDKHSKRITGVSSKRKEALRHAVNCFGGYTLVEATGGWINSVGTLVEEKSMLLIVYTDTSIELLREFTRHLANLFDQEAVLLAVEPVTTLEFIGNKFA